MRLLWFSRHSFRFGTLVIRQKIGQAPMYLPPFRTHPMIERLVKQFLEEKIRKERSWTVLIGYVIYSYPIISKDMNRAYFYNFFHNFFIIIFSSTYFNFFFVTTLMHPWQFIIHCQLCIYQFSNSW
jgi:hypothetical protein